MGGSLLYTVLQVSGGQYPISIIFMFRVFIEPQTALYSTYSYPGIQEMITFSFVFQPPSNNEAVREKYPGLVKNKRDGEEELNMT